MAKKALVLLVCFLFAASAASAAFAAQEEYGNKIKEGMKNVMPTGSAGGTLKKAKLVTVPAGGESQVRETLGYKPTESREQLFFKEERRSPLGFSKSPALPAPTAGLKTVSTPFVPVPPSVSYDHATIGSSPTGETNDEAAAPNHERTVKTRHGTEFVFKNNLIVQVTDARGVVTSFEYVRDESGKIVKKIARRSDGKIQFFYYK